MVLTYVDFDHRFAQDGNIHTVSRIFFLFLSIPNNE